jgi:hypothetical protein
MLLCLSLLGDDSHVHYAARDAFLKEPDPFLHWKLEISHGHHGVSLS